MDKFRTVFFINQGILITSGRKIKSVIDLPLSVQTGLNTEKTRMEKKFGAFTVSMLHEMVKDNLTKCYISMENNRAVVTLSVNTTGTAIIEKKTIRNLEPSTVPAKEAIAKNN